MLFQLNHLDPLARQRNQRGGYQKAPHPSSKSHLLACLIPISNYADGGVRVNITYAERSHAPKRLSDTAATAIFEFTSSGVDGSDSGHSAAPHASVSVASSRHNASPLPVQNSYQN